MAIKPIPQSPKQYVHEIGRKKKRRVKTARARRNKIDYEAIIEKQLLLAQDQVNTLKGIHKTLEGATLALMQISQLMQEDSDVVEGY